MRSIIIVTITVLAIENNAYKIEFNPENSPSHELQKLIQKGEEYHAEHGEAGESAHKGEHHQNKGAHGHHDIEGEKKTYAASGGHDKGHHHQDGYHDQHHKEHKGEHGYQYEDEGRYAKGHSTKGKHTVHKLDEFKKNTEFFDEDHDAGYKERHGGFEVAKSASGGGYNKGEKAEGGFKKGEYGLKDSVAKNAYSNHHEGYKSGQGYDGAFENGADFDKYANRDGFKSWAYDAQHFPH